VSAEQDTAFIDWRSASAPLAGSSILWMGTALIAALVAWSLLTELDMIASAQGRLVTRSSLQIVQPAETGIVREILVAEGEAVVAGQVLARMDTRLSEADRRQLGNEIRLRQLQLRRIQAELSARAMTRQADDPPVLFGQVEAQHRARRQAHLDHLAAERAIVAKAEQDLSSALEVETRLRRTLPIYREQEQAIDQLTRDGFAGRLMLLDRQRERIQQEQDLAAQHFNIASFRATIVQAQQRIAQIQSAYREALHNERVDTEASLHRLEREWDKLAHRQALLELKAPHEGTVKDLATRTVGSVVAAGTVLMTVVPANEPLHAEVWITHQDAGFIRQGQAARLKLAAYPFQRFGMMDGRVTHISPDASELPQAAHLERRRSDIEHVMPTTGYRTLISLDAPALTSHSGTYKLAPGMQVAAELHLGTRTVIEYLFDPIRKAAQEAAREF
jgi:hemolysin D